MMYSPEYVDQLLVKLELAAAIHDKQQIEYLHKTLVENVVAWKASCNYWADEYNELRKSYGL